MKKDLLYTFLLKWEYDVIERENRRTFTLLAIYILLRRNTGGIL